MKEKVPARTHHIEFYREQLKLISELCPQLFEEELMKLLEQHCFVGSRKEQRRFLDANKQVADAVREERVVDIGEKPDRMCDACLDLDCNDAGIVRRSRSGGSEDAIAIQDHLGALLRISDEVDELGFNLRTRKGWLSANRYFIIRAGELLGDYDCK